MQNKCTNCEGACPLRDFKHETDGENWVTKIYFCSCGHTTKIDWVKDPVPEPDEFLYDEILYADEENEV